CPWGVRSPAGVARMCSHRGCDALENGLAGARCVGAGGRLPPGRGSDTPGGPGCTGGAAGGVAPDAVCPSCQGASAPCQTVSSAGALLLGRGGGGQGVVACWATEATVLDARGRRYQAALEDVLHMLERERLGAGPADVVLPAATVEPRNPYKGLRAFTQP